MPLFASLAVAFSAWIQVKQHQELTQSYSVAAHELGCVLAEERYINTEDELSQFVAGEPNR